MLVEKTNDGITVSGSMAGAPPDHFQNKGSTHGVEDLPINKNVSGFKVFTRELDDLIIEHPAVAMAGTVGMPNPDRPGAEIVATAVVLKPGFEKNEETRNSIIDFVKQRAAPYKVPKKVIFMDQLPTSAVGKVLKREPREILTK